MRYGLLFVIVSILFATASAEWIDHKFVIIIPSFNNRQDFFDGVPVYKKNLLSVFNQTYQNYRVIYIDDCSPDGTGFAVREFVAQMEQQYRVQVIVNDVSLGALANRYLATQMCDDREIIVTLDGDDMLAYEHVLEHLNGIYQDEHVWMTYGQFKRCCDNCKAVGAPDFYRSTEQCLHDAVDDSVCHPLPPKEFIERNEFREYVRLHRPGRSWIFGALRTFYAGLFKKILLQDLVAGGLFYGIGEDCAVTFYMAEMAGHHIRFIPEIMYIYNNTARSGSGRDQYRPVFWFEEMERRAKYQPIISPFLKNPEQKEDDIFAHYYVRTAVREYYLNNFYGCIAASKRALLLHPASADAYVNMCAAYNALERFDDARKAGEMAVACDPQLASGHKHLAYALSKLA